MTSAQRTQGQLTLVAGRPLTRLIVAVSVALMSALVALGAAPSAAAETATLQFVGAASTAGNRTTHAVAIPSAVRARDTLVLFLTTNSTTSTITDNIPGWTLIESRDGNGIRGRAWAKQAGDADAGGTVSVASSAYTKSTMAVAAYRSSLSDSKVTASASAVDATTTTTVTAPSVPVIDEGSVALSFWSEKSSIDQTWTLPAETNQRAASAATGTGKVGGVLGDRVVPVGTSAAQSATLSSATTRSASFSVVVSPGASLPNQAPAAAFGSSCATVVCSFDASASTDFEGSALSYTWDFGDGTTGTGVTTNHRYAVAGSRVVSLTVSDGELTGTTTRQLNLSTPSPVTGHNGLVPDTPRTDLPKITNGEIWDIELAGDRVFVAGTFTTITNNRVGDTTSYNQPYLASYNLATGLVDGGFRPVFGGGGVESMAFSPDGARLYVAGAFNSVNGVTKRGVVQLDPVTGAVVSAFTATTSAKATQLAVTDDTVYIGGKFTTVNGVARSGLAAVDPTTGEVRSEWVNNLTGGMGVNGELTVQRLLLTHDRTTLVVLHTGRQVNGQDRYGIATIDTRTGVLNPWRTRLWEDNLAFVGGIQRIYAGDIAPDDSYFVVTSASGGDRPPINDTVIAFDLAGGDRMQPRWITRCFDSVYSVAVTENAVYVGGHYVWTESQSAPDPWPGLEDVGYGTGQGLSGYGLGDAVVKRAHIGALDPSNGKALEWNPGSNSYEGNKALKATPRGLFTGGDATAQGGYSVGRIAFYDFASAVPGNGVETTITDPIEGRVKPAASTFTITGTASTTAGTVRRVTLEILDRDAKKYLQDDLTSWAGGNTIVATLANPSAASTAWSLTLNIPGNKNLQVLARTTASTGSFDPTKASKKFETFGTADASPTAAVTGPANTSPVRSTTFTITGTAADDVGVSAISLTLRDAANQYLQEDGTTSASYYAFRFTPDVVGARATTWAREMTVPYEGTWRTQVRSIDTAGQTALDTADRSWVVSSSGTAPEVMISDPVAMIPPTATAPLVVAPGSPLTFAGSANSAGTLASVEIQLANSTTREQLAADGTWGSDVVAGWHRITPINLADPNVDWSYTTPFTLSPGSYTFTVRATDTLGLVTPSTNQGKLSITAQVPGDAAPNGLMSVTTTTINTTNLQISLNGTATDDKGVAAVGLALRDADTARYLQPDGSLDTAFATIPSTLAAPGATSTSWSRTVLLPTQGDWTVTALAMDTVGQSDMNTSGAVARFLVYPGDSAPVFSQSLMAPTEGTAFADGRIFVSGRAEDNLAMAQVQVAIVDSFGRYMSASGSFTSTSVSWRSSFLTSPGTAGSNFSFTTPVIPAGSYKVLIQAVDGYGLISAMETRHVTVSLPPNNAPVATFSYSCASNVCAFDGRASTDENPTSLTYAWSYGSGQGTGTGPVPTKIYSAPGTFTVTLTVTDEWLATATATATITMTEPASNLAPVAVINPPSCVKLTCNISAVGSFDPNPGDTFTYRWTFGFTTPSSGSASLTRTFPAPGTYTLTLTVKDGWGKSTTVSRNVTVNN